MLFSQKLDCGGCYIVSLPRKHMMNNPADQVCQAAPLETIGLFGFAWTSLGPPVHWIAPLIFSTLVGIANVSLDSGISGS